MTASHPHDIDMNNMSLSAVWSTSKLTVSCSKCRYKSSGSTQRMIETITEEILLMNREFTRGLHTPTTQSPNFCNNAQACAVCIRRKTSRLDCTGGNYYPTNFNCDDTNVIYCLQCTHCPSTYIGQTGRKLKIRIKEHLRAIKSNKPNSSVAIHMNKHSESDFTVSVLGSDEHVFKRLVIESIWIKLTGSHSGMNTQCWGHYDLSTLTLSTYQHFQHDKAATPLIHTTLL